MTSASARWLRVLVSLSIALVACEPQTPTAVAMSEKAAALLNAGAGLMGEFEFEKASEAFGGVLAIDANNPYARLDAAIALMNQTQDGSQARAIELFKPLCADPIVGDRANYCIALNNLYLGEVESARVLLEKLSVTHTDDAFVAYYLGQALELSGDLAGARSQYTRAAQLDGYLRSAVLGIQRILARGGESEAAAAQLALFDRLALNPRSTLAQFKYTRMGPLAEVVLPPSVSSGNASESSSAGAFFAPSVQLKVEGLPAGWSAVGCASTVDLNGDGKSEFIWQVSVPSEGSRFLPMFGVEANGATHWRADPEHPIAQVKGVSKFWWSDLNNDGRIDAVVSPMRKSMRDDDEANQPLYWLEQRSDGSWTSRSFGQVSSVGDYVLALADFDHDGDVDVLMSAQGKEGGARILYNTLGPEWAAVELPSAPKIAGAVVLDVDLDGDLDIVAYGYPIQMPGVTSVLINDRLWEWRRDSVKYASLESARITHTAAWIDPDSGLPMLATVERNYDHGTGPYGDICVWKIAPEGQRRLAKKYFGLARWIAVADATGDGTMDLLVGGQFLDRPFSWIRSPNISAVLFNSGCDVLEEIECTHQPCYSEHEPFMLSGTGLVLASEAFHVALPGPGRGPVATIAFSGRTDPAQQMRTNSSGVGTTALARIGQRWSSMRQLPWNTNSGQSTDPCMVGLGGESAGDGEIAVLSIAWPDGVLQTQRNLGEGKHTVVETQRQISSCPVVFAWDGTHMQFITDCLGVGGVGYLATVERDSANRIRPIYAPPRPWERVAIPAESLAVRNGLFEIALSEPMEEMTALDSAVLTAIDLPDGWQLSFDERMGISDPQPTGKPIYWRESMVPSKAFVAHGSDAPIDQLEQTVARDGLAVNPGVIDSRFIGRTESPFTLELTFAREITSGNGDPVILMDGWIEYPYCQTNFAMWQAGAALSPPTFEALDPNTGVWKLLVREFGYPAGMPREAAFPLERSAIPVGCKSIRVTTNHEIYIDRCRMVYSEDCPLAVTQQARLQSATVADSGFARRIPATQRRPDYDYEARIPLWDCRKQAGMYTQTGVNCSALIESVDDAVAVFGGGEEIRLYFEPPPSVQAGMTRWYSLDLNGWCKDMDFLTGDGATIDPLPMRATSLTPSPLRDSLHEKFNTRYEAGR